MQGTVMMLMALSGLGCHNKGCDVVYAAPTYSCYSSGCYANVYPSYVSPQSYTGCYAGGYSGCYATIYDGGCFGGGCYGGGGSSCYSACYGGGGHHGCGFLARLFSCCSKRHSCYGGGYGSGYGYGSYGDDFYGGPGGYDLPYSPAMYGYAVPFPYGVNAPGEAAPVTAPGATMMPSEAAPPVPATPVPGGTAPAATPVAPDPNTPPAPPRPAVPATPVPAAPKPTT